MTFIVQRTYIARPQENRSISDPILAPSMVYFVQKMKLRSRVKNKVFIFI